jgi:hypothetical protein
MAKFSTNNQYNQKYKIGGFGGNCNACPVFALLTIKNFMDNGQVTLEQHDKNLECAVMNYVNDNTHELPKYLSFGELLVFTGGEYNEGNIGGATPEIINEFGYEMMFKPIDDTNNYSVVFLKNGNFIAVLIKNTLIDGVNFKSYAVRDCHCNDQFDFDSFDALKVHFSKMYQFNELTVVDGVLIEEYGNIEFLIFEKQFPIIVLNNDLVWNGSAKHVDIDDVGDIGNIDDVGDIGDIDDINGDDEMDPSVLDKLLKMDLNNLENIQNFVNNLIVGKKNKLNDVPNDFSNNDPNNGLCGVINVNNPIIKNLLKNTMALLGNSKDEDNEVVDQEVTDPDELLAMQLQFEDQ